MFRIIPQIHKIYLKCAQIDWMYIAAVFKSGVRGCSLVSFISNSCSRQVTQYLLDKALIMDEDTLYDLSLKIEPRLPAWPADSTWDLRLPNMLLFHRLYWRHDVCCHGKALPVWRVRTKCRAESHRLKFAEDQLGLSSLHCHCVASQGLWVFRWKQWPRGEEENGEEM